jgi:N6-L-threonylcarbamoyladenine synthase
MLHSKDFDFSFSGLKTAVLYLLKKLSEQDGVTPVSDSPREVRVSRRLQSLIAREFENAVTEVLVAKTKAAIEQYGAKTLLIGGGVIANTHIRRAFEDLENSDGRRDLLNGLALYIPEPELTTDNALMIAVAGAIRFAKGGVSPQTASFRAQGNLRLAQNTDL